MVIIMRNAQWMSGRYGVMVHFLSEIGGADGTKKLTPNEMADCFDVKVFADKLEEMGAGWVIFPFGQNSGYYWSENLVIEKRIQGRCTKRDLIVEIAEELELRGIRFIAYLPTEIDAQSEEMRKAFAWDESADKKEFMTRYTPVVKYYAEKLGKLLDGWWFDGCYNSGELDYLRTHDWTNDRFDKTEWFSAAKAGNKDAVIAMSTGANNMQYVFEEEDYLPGEAGTLSNYPWDYDSGKKQWHILTWLDCFWWLKPGAVMPEPRYSNDELCEYVKKCIDKKGAVTLNIGIYEDGKLAEKTVEQVCGLKTVLNNNIYSGKEE